MLRRKNREPSKLRMKPLPSTYNTQGVRSLNVNFEYENYTYDAFHVLGLPSGSSWESVQAAYRQVLYNSPYSKECIQMAFEALQRFYENRH